MSSIKTYRHSTVMGKTVKKIPFLTPKEQDNFDNIGYAGKLLNGKKMTREQYLNTLEKGHFKVEILSCNSCEFTEELLIIQVL